MTYRLSRLMSTATASYGVYALVSPRHLGKAVTDNGKDQGDYDLLAQTYGARDVPLSLIGMFARSEKAIQAVMLARIAFDVADGLLLSTKAANADVRTKVLGVTMGWATLNATALLVDRRRNRSRSLTVKI